MLIPYGTDAPVYHKPWATVALCAISVVTYVVYTRTTDADLWEALSLQLGHGLILHQWVTSLFVHQWWREALANILFLWCFGQVVEGKVGWKWFLAVYLGCGAGGMGAMQLLLFDDIDDERVITGASGAISALMGVAGVWAPRNDIHFRSLWGLRDFSVPVFHILVFRAVIAGLIAVLSAFAIVEVTIQVLGFAMGAAIAWYFLKHDLVDCEGWDLLTIRKYGRPMDAAQRRQADARAALDDPAAAGPSLSEAMERMRTGVEADLRGRMAAGDLPGFLAAWRKAVPALSPWTLPPDLVRGLAQAHVVAGEHHEAATVLEKALAAAERDPTGVDVPGLRVALAQEYILHLGRPQGGMDLLDALPGTGLSPTRQALLRDLTDKAKKDIAAGVLEMA
jgi:membrane associated rhomboid family serine protease